MSDTTHTKGPWKLVEFDQGWLLTGADGTVIETIYKDGATQEANAQLIVKAPELLDALTDCMLELGYVTGMGNKSVLSPNSARVLETANALLNELLVRKLTAGPAPSA